MTSALRNFKKKKKKKIFPPLFFSLSLQFLNKSLERKMLPKSFHSWLFEIHRSIAVANVIHYKNKVCGIAYSLSWSSWTFLTSYLGSFSKHHLQPSSSCFCSCCLLSAGDWQAVCVLIISAFSRGDSLLTASAAIDADLESVTASYPEYQ